MRSSKYTPESVDCAITNLDANNIAPQKTNATTRTRVNLPEYLVRVWVPICVTITLQPASGTLVYQSRRLCVTKSPPRRKVEMIEGTDRLRT